MKIAVINLNQVLSRLPRTSLRPRPRIGRKDEKGDDHISAGILYFNHCIKTSHSFIELHQLLMLRRRRRRRRGNFNKIYRARITTRNKLGENCLEIPDAGTWYRKTLKRHFIHPQPWHKPKFPVHFQTVINLMPQSRSAFTHIIMLFHATRGYLRVA